MNETRAIWKPGSFTKNFSWGPTRSGLKELHSIIRQGFGNEMEPVPRATFRERVSRSGRPDYIPLNFFLYNAIIGNESYILPDELVFQALNWDHSSRFDKLALFSFLLSLSGAWNGAKSWQRRPALWANAYIVERVSRTYDWDIVRITANDIDDFVKNDKRYEAETTRKLSTNLYYLLQIGRINEYQTPRVERWWVDCIFLALDRIISDERRLISSSTKSEYLSLLNDFDFIELTGKSSTEKRLASSHLVDLYIACGGVNRFSEDAVKERTGLLVPDFEFYLANDARPRGAVHVTNPRILKSIPSACAMLVKYAGFQDLTPDELENFCIDDFIKRHTQEALDKLKAAKVSPTMSAEELLRLTRGE